jgi:hypothetical protein
MRSLSYLRRGLLSAALAGSLGFGATQALAVPGPGPGGGGNPGGGFCVLGDPGAHAYCQYWCQETMSADGWCLPSGACTCY